MALNLVRNSRVFFTTNVNASTGVINATGADATNTFEIQVLDGFTFSQNTNADTVTISEAGGAPVRGQRSFNTSLAPVDFSFSTYARPYNTGTAVTAEESVLWNALLGTTSQGTAAVTVGGTISGVTYAFSAGVGTLTIAGTSLTAVGVAVGDVITIGSISTTTPASSLTAINAPATVKTISGTSITLELVNPTTTATTITTPASIKFYKSAWAPVSTGFSVATAAQSNANQLQKFGMIFVVDSVAYAVDNAALGQVSIDFGLDAIATLAWTGQATSLRQITTSLTNSTFTGADFAGTSAAKNTSAGYITNKLSTVSMSLVNAIGAATAGTTYAVALTGGSITINNNINYITPANLGVVNLPVTYYTGTRAITGTLNAYLKTGSGVGGTGQLLADMLAAASTTIEPMVALQIAIGGGANTVKIVLDMPASTITIPSVDVQQVVSTAINFTAEGYVPSSTANANVFDLTKTNDIAIRYYA
jgi:hypothetical protein